MLNRWQGFTGGRATPIAIAVVVAILAVGVLLFAPRGSDAGGQRTDGQAVQQAPQVTNRSDLDAAQQFVANTDIDGALDTSQIDSALGR